jgi:predicted O-linked N-acetylglucosamine transferase (SPINDLY family)
MSQITIEQALQTAIGHHGAGRLAEAEGIYRQILARFPDHADALHLLGVLACETGHTAAAIELIGRAIALNPGVAEYQSNLGEAYRRAGQWDQAIVHFRRAIVIRPNLAKANNSLGIALRNTGRLDEAVASYQQALAIEPRYAEAHSNLGNALKDQGQLDEAVASLRRALELKPDYAAAYSNLGNALSAQGRLDEALAALDRAIELRPDLAEAHNNRGSALLELARFDDAIASFGRALALKPDYAEAHCNLGNALKELGRLEPAIESYRRALELKPDFAEAHSNLGIAFKELGHLDRAIASYRRALELKPSYWGAHSSLGNAFKEVGRLDEAVACFRKAVALRPDHAPAASNLVLTLNYHPDYDAQAILAEHRWWASQYAEPLAAQIRPHANDRSTERKLRVGFLSPDFRSHPVGRLLVPLLAHRDRGQAEFIVYSDVRLPDGVTHQLQALADDWQNVVGVGDARLADQIRGDRIDILVDLALHTAHNRLLVFARKPAPVQATMLGMPATTGLATMDYRITDSYLDPPGTGDEAYTEESIRLPHCYWCFQPPEAALPVSELSARSRGFITFGCLNHFAKVSPGALTVWCSILHALPTARLVIQSPEGAHRDAVHALFRKDGIASDRVEFVAHVPRTEYFRRYQGLDLCLDPFPYNGHTSTLDSLWMGVPVITLAGSTAVGRGGMSILSNAGLPGLIARTPQEYVDFAVAWAGDQARLAALRAGLRQRMEASPLMDSRQFAADVDAAFRGMWKNWCKE